MPIPSGFASHIDLLDPLCYPGSGLIIDDLANPSVAWNISASGAVYDANVGALSLSTQTIEANGQLVNTGDGPITIAGWVKINQYSYGTSFNCLPAIGRATDGNNFRQLALYGAVPNAVGLGNCSNGSGFVYGIAETPIQTWAFVVIKKDTGQTTSQYKTYVNGVPNEAGSAGANVTTSIAYDGTFSYGLINGTIFGAGAANFPMSISQIWMYNSYLSDAQVLDLYNATKNRYLLKSHIDLLDPACYSGTGNTIFDLVNPSAKWQISGSSTYDNTVGAITWGATTEILLDTQLSQSGTTGRTIAAWIKWPQDGPVNPGEGVQPFLQIGDDTSYNNMCLTMASNTEIGGRFPILKSGDSFNSIVTAVAYTPNWTFVAMTVPNSSGASSGNIYLNGTTVGSPLSYNVPAGTLNVTYTSNQFGIYNHDFGLYGTQSAGTVSQHWIYDRVLSGGEISDLYNSTKGRYATPVIEYDFSESACYPGSGTTVFNLSPGGYDFPIVNGATFVGAGSSSYFTFNGVNQYIGQGFSGGPGLGTTFSATVWVQANNGNIGSIWNSGFDSPLGREPGMYLNARAFAPDPGYADASFNFGIGYLDMASPQTIGDWFNLAYVADGTNVSLYVNGVLDSTGSQGGGLWAAGGFVLGAHLSSGGAVDGPFLNAKIAYYSAYDVALSSTDILNIFNSQESRFLAPPPPYAGNVGGRSFGQGFNG